MQPVAGHNQYESFRYPYLTDYLQRSAGSGQVTDDAIDRTAAELDRSCFQDAVAWGFTSFGHIITAP